MELEIKSPVSEALIQSRNDLLQATMRPVPALFPIAMEYPLVLSASHTKFSHCVLQSNRVCAHANLWPRHVVDSSARRITTVGLVGNVATIPELQGQGVMTKLMTYLDQVAIDSGLSHLILWSDLSRFYQKRGFASLGIETRMFFGSQALDPFYNKARFVVIDPMSCNDSDLQKFLQKRPTVPLTLQRSPGEFRSQLQIPGTYLIFDTQQDQCFAVVGKGYDMAGIMHEWGTETPADLLAMLSWARKTLEIPEIGLLIPGSADSIWRNDLKKECSREEEFPMAMAKEFTTPGGRSHDLSKMFIWGLDAI